MRKISIIVFFIVLSLQVNSSAQINPGAKEISLSHSTVALCDNVFSLYYNPAGLDQLMRKEVGIYYSPAPFELKQLSNTFIAYSHPFNFGTLAFGISQYGFKLYKENTFTVGYSARVIESIYTGLAITYNYLNIQNYGHTASITADLGLLIKMTEELKFGFAVSNITRSSYGKSKNQIPTSIQLGCAYSLPFSFTITGAFEKEITEEESIRFGIENNLVEYLSLRAGFATGTNSFSAGVGFNIVFVKFDYAVFNHLDLGYTHQASVIINIDEI
ncbi:MAG: hypothetical protein KJ799_13900 [Bacteroidetes bacterium]|nr:hypothetical protein [Bacteroidota bacterium]